MAERVVQLHFGRFVHPVYREQLHAAPAGWRYTSPHPSLRDETAPTKRVIEQQARFARARELAEQAALRLLSEAGYVHVVRAPRDPQATIIHSAERLIRRSPLPYVVDFEHAELFVLYQSVALRRPWAREALERLVLDERLRFLLGWSDAARRSMLAVLGPEAAERAAAKVRVVSPAIRLAAERPHRRGDGPLGRSSSAPRSTRRARSRPSRRCARCAGPTPSNSTWSATPRRNGRRGWPRNPA